MIRIIRKIPRNVTIAFSGGIDSVVFTEFLLKGKRKINLAFFNHDTNTSRIAQDFVEKYAEMNNLNLKVGHPTGHRGKRSLEEFWRDERYNFLQSLNEKFIITGHHLNDVVETWVMSALHGKPKLIPYRREGTNIYRPFLMTEKSVILNFAKKNNLMWSEDPSNANTNFIRNHIRHNMMPLVLKVNPGIKTTIRKKLLEKYKET